MSKTRTDRAAEVKAIASKAAALLPDLQWAVVELAADKRVGKAVKALELAANELMSLALALKLDQAEAASKPTPLFDGPAWTPRVEQAAAVAEAPPPAKEVVPAPERERPKAFVAFMGRNPQFWLISPKTLEEAHEAIERAIPGHLQGVELMDLDWITQRRLPDLAQWCEQHVNIADTAAKVASDQNPSPNGKAVDAADQPEPALSRYIAIHKLTWQKLCWIEAVNIDAAHTVLCEHLGLRDDQAADLRWTFDCPVDGVPEYRDFRMTDWPSAKPRRRKAVKS